MSVILRIACATCLGACLITGPVLADGLNGLYRTEPNKKGGVLHVSFGSCKEDASLVCGTIAAAFDANSAPREDYAYLGKPIVWNMKEVGGGKFVGGRLWDPTANKVYKSRMYRRNGAIKVSGCIGPVCKTQNWRAVK